MDPRTRAALLHVLMQEDKQQMARPGGNPYALAYSCGALHHCEELVAAGHTVREALMIAFNGRLLATLLKAGQEAEWPPYSTTEDL